MKTASAFNLDETFYIVFDRDFDIRETPKPMLTLDGAVQMVEELDWDISHVFSFNPIVRVSGDATLEIAEAISSRLFDQNCEPLPDCAKFLDRMGLDYPTEESVEHRQVRALRHARAA